MFLLIKFDTVNINALEYNMYYSIFFFEGESEGVWISEYFTPLKYTTALHVYFNLSVSRYALRHKM